MAANHVPDLVADDARELVFASEIGDHPTVDENVTVLGRLGVDDRIVDDGEGVTFACVRRPCEQPLANFRDVVLPLFVGIKPAFLTEFVVHLLAIARTRSVRVERTEDEHQDKREFLHDPTHESSGRYLTYNPIRQLIVPQFS